MKHKVILLASLFTGLILQTVPVSFMSCKPATLAAAPALAPPTTPTPPPAPPKPIVLKAVSHQPKGHTHSISLKWLGDIVKEKSKGRLEINHLGGAEVIPGSNLAESVRTGVVDIVIVPSGYYEGEFPALGETPKLSPFTPTQNRENGAYNLFKELYEKKFGVLYLGEIQAGIPRYIFLTRPITRLADFRGLKIRVTSTDLDFVKALGALPTTIPLGEIYTAMERGVVDGFAFSATGNLGYKQVMKYKVDHPYYQANVEMLGNLATWKRLSLDLQNLMLDAVKEIERKIVPYREAEAIKEQEEIMADGMKLITLPPDEAKEFRALAYRVGWERSTRTGDPEFVTKLRKIWGN